MSEVNQYRMLSIRTKGFLPIEEVTDEIIAQKYKEMKAKLDEMLGNAMLSQKEIDKIEESLRLINEAFKTLETEEKRKKYEEPYHKENALKMTIESLIKEEGGNPLEEIKSHKMNVFSKAANVKENADYLQYTPEYEDEKISLLGLADIQFMNGNQYKDTLKEYAILLKEKQSPTLLGYDFYSKIDIEEMEKKEYRIALYKSISKAMEKKAKYIGTIAQDQEQNYITILDGGQEDAAKEHQLQLENAIRAKAKARQGEGR